jgi:hypothetical protein
MILLKLAFTAGFLFILLLPLHVLGFDEQCKWLDYVLRVLLILALLPVLILAAIGVSIMWMM